MDVEADADAAEETNVKAKVKLKVRALRRRPHHPIAVHCTNSMVNVLSTVKQRTHVPGPNFATHQKTKNQIKVIEIARLTISLIFILMTI